MQHDHQHNLLDKTFNIAVIIKGIDGMLEVMGGLILFFAHNVINYLIIFLTQHELIEDPRDFVANYLFNLAHHFSVGSQIVVAAYLILHGIIKISLVISLLKNKLWAYPTAMVFFVVFIFYEIYRYFIAHSVWILLLITLDALVIGLVYFEYKRRLKRILNKL